MRKYGETKSLLHTQSRMNVRIMAENATHLVYKTGNTESKCQCKMLENIKQNCKQLGKPENLIKSRTHSFLSSIHLQALKLSILPGGLMRTCFPSNMLNSWDCQSITAMQPFPLATSKFIQVPVLMPICTQHLLIKIGI